jgi:carboxypeptidase family protein
VTRPGGPAIRRIAASARAALAILAAASLSCSDLPTQPLGLATVTGTVLDRDGTPLEGFQVAFANRLLNKYYRRGAPDPLLYATARTGPDGTYQVHLYEGTYDIQVAAGSYSGYPSARLAAVIHRGTARVEYRYTGVWIRGVVYGPGGVRLLGATAQVISLSPAGQFLNYSSGIDGGQGFKVLGAPGRFEFRIDPPYGSDGVPSLRFRGFTVESDTTLTFSLDGFPVSGVVTGRDGEPLPGLDVVAFDNNAEGYCSSLTGANGSYLVRLPAGTYRWDVYTSGALSYIAPREFPPTSVSGAATYDFSMGGTLWSGRVRLLPDSLPARDYGVFTQPESYLSVGSASTETDSGGAFQVVVPQGQLYSIQVEQPVSNGLYWTVGNLLAGSDSTLDLVLDPAAGHKQYFIEASALTPAQVRPAPDRALRPAPALLPRP